MPENVDWYEGAVLGGSRLADNLHDGILDDDSQLRDATVLITNNFPVAVTGYWCPTFITHAGGWNIEDYGGHIRAYHNVDSQWREIFTYQKFRVTIDPGVTLMVPLLLEGISPTGSDDLTFKVDFHVINVANESLQGGLRNVPDTSDNVALSIASVDLAVGPTNDPMPELFEDTLPMVVPMNRDYDLGYVDGQGQPVPDGTDPLPGGATMLPENWSVDDELVETNIHFPFPFFGTWNLVIPDELRVWNSATRERVESGTHYAFTSTLWCMSVGLRIEGLAPSGTPPYLTVSAQYTDAGGIPQGLPIEDQVKVEVVSIDLEIAEISELDEATQPAFVPLNDDYDEGNVHSNSGEAVTDNSRLHDQIVSVPPRIVSNDDDLVHATLTIDGPAGQSGKYWIEVFNEPEWLQYPDWPGYNQYVRVWQSDGVPVPRDPASALPITLDEEIELLVEGLAPYYDHYFEHLGLKAHFIPDGDYAEAGVFPDVTDEVMADVIPIAIDLLVDTDRDNSVTSDDEEGEDDWIRARGAIILLNSDIDNTTGAPDNWTGGDYGGDTYNTNNEVDGNGDINDIGPLVLKKLNIDTLPDNLVVTLSVSKPPAENAWFAQFSAEQRVRIFLPDNGSSVAEGDEGIIGPGPDLAASVEFVKDPLENYQYDYSIFSGSGDIRFGIEGIIPGAMVDITATISLNGKVLKTDTVRVKVTPFILLDNTDNVADGDDTVFVSEESLPGAVDNAALRSVLHLWFGDSLNWDGPLEDVWLQDGCEIGYVQAPYGEMPMVLELPRSQRD
ncbi:MAG: protein-arginine deiminase domain-containing protein, partial [Pirellulales bacterium]|nr:protein-arginine deiminase domain-containing protein [Pirellulales bacterium]